MGSPASQVSRLFCVPLRKTSLLLAVAIYALYRAWELRWVSDDAFISFRYAENFVRGLGLVYNQGERVEGYTNFLWTLLLSPAFFFSALDIEFLSEILGIVFYTGSLFLLYWFSKKQGHLPVSFVGFGLFFHGQVYATGGLETAFYTFFVVWIAVRLHRLHHTPAFLDYFLAAIASLIRPDGLLLFVVIFLQDILISFHFRKRVLCLVQHGSSLQRNRLWHRAMFFRQTGFYIVFFGFLTWRYSYYGYFLPNTYYAKSANQSYWSQGFSYALLFFSSYYVFVFALLFMVFRFIRKGTTKLIIFWKTGNFRFSRRTAFLTAWGAFLFIHFLYYIRIGGGFMFARFFIPAIPVLLMLFEVLWKEIQRPFLLKKDGIADTGKVEGRRGCTAGLWIRSNFFIALIFLFWMGLLFRYDPYRGEALPLRYGISEEHKFYSRKALQDLRQKALALRPFFREARIAIGGSQAALAYYLDPPFVLESETGLTDAYLARLPLQGRGRIGHEKKAPLSYLRSRRVHLHLLPPSPKMRHSYNRFVMPGFHFGDMRILVYENKVFKHFPRSAGFYFEDFPLWLDVYIQKSINKKNIIELKEDYKEFCNYYFRWNKDSARESVFKNTFKALSANKADWLSCPKKNS